MNTKTLYINFLNFSNDQHTGVANYTINLFANHFTGKALSERFSKIIVLCSSEKIVRHFFPYTFTNLYFKPIPLAQSRLFRIFFEQLILPFLRIPVNTIFYSPTPSIPLLLKVTNSKVITICTVHDLTPFHISNKYLPLRQIYVKNLTKYSLKFSTKVFTVSNFTKFDIINKWSINESKISVIPNGISEFKSNKNKNNSIISISTIEPGKNIELLVNSFSQFRKKYPQYQDFKLYIIGGFGWGSRKFKQTIHKLQKTENVYFTGYISNSTKDNLIANCYFHVLLSRYEGFGLPILECFQRGKPSVTLNNSALPEVVGFAGVTVDKEEIDSISAAFHFVITNYEKLQSVIPKHLEKYSLDNIRANFINSLRIEP